MASCSQISTRAILCTLGECSKRQMSRLPTCLNLSAKQAANLCRPLQTAHPKGWQPQATPLCPLKEPTSLAPLTIAVVLEHLQLYPRLLRVLNTLERHLGGGSGTGQQFTAQNRVNVVLATDYCKPLRPTSACPPRGTPALPPPLSPASLGSSTRLNVTWQSQKT